MSERLGPAGGRCFTVYTSNRIMNDRIMNMLDVPLQNNYAYRTALEKGGAPLLYSLMKPVESSVRVDHCAKCMGPNPFRK